MRLSKIFERSKEESKRPKLAALDPDTVLSNEKTIEDARRLFHIAVEHEVGVEVDPFSVFGCPPDTWARVPSVPGGYYRTLKCSTSELDLEVELSRAGMFIPQVHDAEESLDVLVGRLVLIVPNGDGGKQVELEAGGNYEIPSRLLHAAVFDRDTVLRVVYRRSPERIEELGRRRFLGSQTIKREEKSEC